jgi:hypothetical protein
VFAGVQVAAAGTLDGAEYQRRDASLNIRFPATVFDLDAWPQPPAPSLDRARQLSLPRSPQQVQYFNTGYQYRSQASCPMWP